MDYHKSIHMAQTSGLVLLILVFAGATIYALWPGNSKTFDRAAQTPLQDGPEDGEDDER